MPSGPALRATASKTTNAKWCRCGSSWARFAGGERRGHHERFVFCVYDPFVRDFARPKVWTMKLRISFYGESSDAHPNILANSTGDFASLTDARETAFEDANKPDMRAHSIIIETVDRQLGWLG